MGGKEDSRETLSLSLSLGARMRKWRLRSGLSENRKIGTYRWLLVAIVTLFVTRL